MKKRVIVLDTNVVLNDPESPLDYVNNGLSAGNVFIKKGWIYCRLLLMILINISCT